MFTNQNEQFTNLTLSFLRVLRWIAPCPSPLRLKRVYIYVQYSLFFTLPWWGLSMVLQLTIEWPNINIGIPALSAVTWSMCWKISLRYKSKCDTWALSPSLWPWPTEKKKHYKPFFSSLSLQNVASFYISKKNCIFTGKISIFPSRDLSPPHYPSGKL